jgi:translation initiation factor IF-3
VRVIDEEGQQLGVLPVEEAVEAAEDRDLDLVEVSPNADPPVCKIMDLGRYKYTQQKKAQEAKKKQRVVEVKEVKLRIKIEKHDYAIKRKHAERFLNDGNKAKVTIMFRGREVTHPDLGRKLLERMANELLEIGTVEQFPNLEGRNMTMVIAPKSTRPPRIDTTPRKKSGRKAEDVSMSEEKLTAPLAEALKGAEIQISPADGAGDEKPEGEVKEDA